MSSARLLNPDFYNVFGFPKYTKFSATSIFTSMFGRKNENELLHSKFKNILSGNVESVNQLELNHLSYSVLSSDVTLFLRVFLSALNDHTKTFSDLLQKTINDKTYTNSMFMQLYSSILAIFIVSKSR